MTLDIFFFFAAYSFLRDCFGLIPPIFRVKKRKIYIYLFYKVFVTIKSIYYRPRDGHRGEGERRARLCKNRFQEGDYARPGVTWLHYTVLHCSTLYYTVHCSTLYYTVHFTSLYHSVLHCATLQYTVLHYTTLYYTVLHCTTLYYTVHCTVRCCTILHQTWNLSQSLHGLILG